MDTRKRTTIYINKPIALAIAGSDSVSGRLGDICDRYLEIMRRADIRSKLDGNEINAIRESCIGSWPLPTRHLDVLIRIKFHSAGRLIYDKHGIDGKATAKKLQSLNHSEMIAMAEILTSKNPLD